MEASEQTPTRKTIEAVWRGEAARLIGGLVRFVRDVERAEDLAQEALLAALEHWPETGVPDSPGAWLMRTAKNRAVDAGRRHAMMNEKHEQLAASASLSSTLDEEALDEPVEDDVLRLMLIACHPVLSRDARVALTLRLISGLSTAEIARGFLTSEVTISQRIVRAKRTLSEAAVPFEVPSGEELRARIPPVLEVVYLVFNEGYSATTGDDWLRPELCDEAIRLGHILVRLIPEDAEAHGLLALMALQASRSRARVDSHGEPVLLSAQDRSRWDGPLISSGLSALARAQALALPLGPYTLQAAIAACHARARRAEDTDWPSIVALYDLLVDATGSPVVELNRAVAVSMAYGPQQALSLLDPLLEEPALRDYHLLPTVHADLLWKLNRRSEARAQLERAAELATNARERALLLARAAECEREPEPTQH